MRDEHNFRFIYLYYIILYYIILYYKGKGKGKGHPAKGRGSPRVLGRLRPRIFLTFGTMWVVGRQSYAPAAFTPGEIPGTHFQRLSRPQGTWSRRGGGGVVPRKKSPVTPPGIDPGILPLVAQCLNHYATPGPPFYITARNTETK